MNDPLVLDAENRVMRWKNRGALGADGDLVQRNPLRRPALRFGLSDHFYRLRRPTRAERGNARRRELLRQIRERTRPILIIGPNYVAGIDWGSEP